MHILAYACSLPVPTLVLMLVHTYAPPWFSHTRAYTHFAHACAHTCAHSCTCLVSCLCLHAHTCSCLYSLGHRLVYLIGFSLSCLHAHLCTCMHSCVRALTHSCLLTHVHVHTALETARPCRGWRCRGSREPQEREAGGGRLLVSGTPSIQGVQ